MAWWLVRGEISRGAPPEGREEIPRRTSLLPEPTETPLKRLRPSACHDAAAALLVALRYFSPSASGLTRAAIAEITPAVLGTWLFVAGKTSQQSHHVSQ
jgi:hypothetical protein